MDITIVIMIVTFIVIMSGFTYIWNRFARLENSEKKK